MHKVIIQQDDFDIGSLHDQLRSPQTGAIVTFIGIVREWADTSALVAMELEHYPGMTEQIINEIIANACQHWPLQASLVIHRVGYLKPGDNIVFTGVASQHRQAAFEANQYIMDHLKVKATFWKKEIMADSEKWLTTKQSDLSALSRWKG